MRLWRACLVLLLIANSVGLGLIYKKIDDLEKLFPFTLLQDSIKTQSEISSQLASIQTLLAKDTSTQTPASVLGLSELLPDKSANPATNSSHFVIAIKNSPAQIQVYKEQADFSATIGQLVPDYKYPYYAKVGNWYLIGFTNSITGWVKASEVTESP